MKDKKIICNDQKKYNSYYILIGGYNMSYSFFLIGGDMRTFYLARELASEGNKVKILGFDKIEYEKLLNNNIEMAHSINEVKREDVLIGSVPLSMDNVSVYAPFSSKKINLSELEGKSIIAGNLTEGIKGWDVLKDESTTILNTIPTAEGAISKAIIESETTLSNENILVLGYGRIGKILCDKLSKIGARVYCEARKESDLAWIEAYGYTPIPLKELNKNLCRFKVIFNTIPAIILDKSRLILIKKDTVLIDLASGNGGIDFESSRKLGIKAIQYLGIPGKCAPKTTSEYIKRYIENTIKK